MAIANSYLVSAMALIEILLLHASLVCPFGVLAWATDSGENRQYQSDIGLTRFIRSIKPDMKNSRQHLPKCSAQAVTASQVRR
jgi:hypothetical protein